MAIELRGVVKQEGGQIHIHETNLSLEKNAFNILLGTTLSGKTTLMRLMAGLEKPSSGRVFFDGRDVTGVAVQKRNISMVYQQFINYPNLTVRENIASPLRVARVSAAEIDRRVAEAAELLRLSPMLDRLPAELSGGQQQRAALARALVKDSDLVLLDEPLANLDYKLREELRQELPSILAEKGAIVVYATSEPHEALLLGGFTAALHEGRIAQFGPTAEVYRNPVDLRTARIFSDPPINTALVAKKGNTFHLNESVKWPVNDATCGLADGEYRVGLRPHHITPMRRGEGSIEVMARVLVTELTGSESIVHLDIGGHRWISQSHGVHAVAIGATETMYLQTHRFMYFESDGSLIAA
ncbi:ABC transporter ATP-binding protein [Thioalkalivibrio sp. HK1]|uniref:ABC transporter ATP-binding protein n=1 Tax=Thioalkalivibrio sp. HK1 TaxID=1469245 RepID=UPI00046FB4A1|nr:ABC transporter ATP-binding protein [Thioalkalivibrio sp. HK1]